MNFWASFPNSIDQSHSILIIVAQMWKKHYEVNGQITQHLSPFEQKVVTPMFKDAHIKIYQKVSSFLLEAGVGLGLGIFVYYWGEAEHKAIAYHHRT